MLRPLKILFVTSEVRPLIKTGGLADVSSSLPAALRDLGLDCRILVPGYPAVLEQCGTLTLVATLPATLLGPARLLTGLMPDTRVPIYVLDAPLAYQRPGGPYLDTNGVDHADNAERFALLSQVAAQLCEPHNALDWQPDCLHVNDWQTGLAPAYLHFSGRPVPSLITIHNLAFQGVYEASLLSTLGLPSESFAVHGLEYYGGLSFLKAGLFYSDWITTVSPRYAMEIQDEPLGMGMQGLLGQRSHRLTGILNGIDTADWNPSSDLHLAHSFTYRAMAGKRRCKAALQAELGLAQSAEVPLFGVVSRLTHQKGLDWILQIAQGLLAQGGQLAILGTGEPLLEAGFRQLALQHPTQVAAFIGYDEGLSHRIEAGADLFLMPSRFEPCGLNQMYSQRYGTLPVVRDTGGLADSVRDGVDGFSFMGDTAHALWLTVERALAAYHDRPLWRRLQQTAMRKDSSWEKSAREYAALYAQLIAQSQH